MRKFCLNNRGDRYPPRFCDDHVLGAFLPVVFLDGVEAKGNRSPPFLPWYDIEGILYELSNILAIVYEDFFKASRRRRYGFILSHSFEMKNVSRALVMSADAIARLL